MKQQFAMVPIERLRLIDNVRPGPGEIAELVESIRQFGILEPIVGCPTEDRENVDVLMGQRRLVAAREAGLTEVPCILRQRPAKRERVLMQLAENLDRADMSPIDEAIAYRELVDEGMRQIQIAHAVHRSDFHVSTRLQLLDMPECVQVALDIGWIPPSSALAVPRELLKNKEAVKRLAKVLSSGPRAVEKWCRDEIEMQQISTTVKRSYSKAVGVGPDAYDAARRAAAVAGTTVTEWVTGVILRAVARQERQPS